MKKLIFSMAALATMLFASCQQQELPEPVAPSTSVSFTVEVPAGVDTKSIADGNNVDELHYAIYKYDHDGKDPDESAHENAVQNPQSTPLATGKVDKTSDKHFNVTFDLLADQNYVVIFWAQVSGKNHYVLGDLRNVRFAEHEGSTLKALGNAEERAAFFRTYEFDTKEVKDHIVTLYRPFAQLNLGTSKESLQPKQGGEVNGYVIDVQKSEVKVTGLSTSFSTIADLGVEEICGEADAHLKDEFVFTLQDVITTGSITDQGTREYLKVTDKNGVDTEYEYVGMNYFFADETTNVTVEYNIQTDRGVVNNTVENVPVKENFRTNIIGNLLTSKTDFEIVVDEDFNKNDINGPEFVQEPKKDEEGNYVITNVHELAWLAAAVNGTLPPMTKAATFDPTFTGQTFILTEDVDLKGKLWTPIGATGKFLGTFDGGENTISNLTVKAEGKNSAGLFANAREVKNLKVVNANIEGQYKTGVIVGDGLCAKIENCHVEGGIITVTPFNKDEGNNVGGIVGYLSGEPTAYVIECSVKDVTIKAVRKVGAIAGAANKSAVVEKNEIENVTIIADQTVEYVKDNKGEDYDGNAGPVVGWAAETATVATSNIVGEGVVVKRYVDSTEEMEHAVTDAKNGDTIYVGNGEVALPHFENKALNFVGVHENAAIVEPVSSHIDAFWQGAELNFTDLKIKGTSYTGKANGYVKSAKETYTRCAFVDGYYMFAGDETIVDDCVFTGKFNSYFWTGSADEITFNNCKFNGVERIVKVCTVGHTGVERKVTFNGCEFTATEQKKAAIEIDGTKGSSYVVNINNCTETGFAPGESTGMPLFNIEGSDNVELYVDGKKWEGNGIMKDAEGNVHTYTVAAIKESVKEENATVYVYPNPATEDGSYDLESKMSLAKGVKLIGAGEEPVKINNSWSSNLFANQAHFTDTYMENIVCDNNLVIDAGIVNGTVVFKNCVFGGKNAHQGVHFDSGNGTVLFDECTFIGRNMFGSSIEKITFNKCYFENKRSSLTGADKWTGVNMWGKYEFNECTFGTEAHCSVKCDGVVAAFNGCKFTDDRDVTSVVNYDGEFDATITFDGNKYVAEGLLENENGDQIAYSEAGLKEALENGGTVVLANPFTIDQSESNGYGKTGINMTNGGTLDGNGNELGAPGSTGTWDSAINTSGGTIKNIKVTKGFRGIFIKNSSHNEKLYLDNVTIEGTTYTISCDQGNGLGLEATNSTFKGWTSYAATLGNAKFTDCYFGYGNGYSYCRPYAPTEFVGCEFEAGLVMDPRAAVTFENCTLDGVALTSENLATLVTDTAKATIK